MDYDILNGAIDDIVWIVNQYNKTRGYEVDVCEKLLLALVGYYLSFGPEIFNKIDIVLDALKIRQCLTKKECISVKEELYPPRKNHISCPSTIWNHKYTGPDKKFIGAIPNIVYCSSGLVEDVLSLIHELSHTLEGVAAIVLSDTTEILRIHQGFEEDIIDKNSGRIICIGRGMTELITITIENKALQEFLKLDAEQIKNPLVKTFLGHLREYKGRTVLSGSYPMMAGVFKDLIDNERFFEMIKEHYYENQQEALIAEFDSLDDRLNFRKLATYADKVMLGLHSDVIYYAAPIQAQLNVLNEVTGVKPDKKMIFVV